MGKHRVGRKKVVASCEKALLAVLAYRIASYWLPLPAGLGAHFVFRHRYGKKSTLTEADATPST